MRSFVVASFVFALLGAGIPVLSAPASDQVLPMHACNGPRCASGVHPARQLDPVLGLTALLGGAAVPTGAAGSTATDIASTSTTDVTIEPSTTTATDTVTVAATTTSFTSSTSLPTNMIVHHARGGAEFNLVSFGAVAGHYSGSNSETESASTTTTTTTVVLGSVGTTTSSIESTETPGSFFKPLVRHLGDLEVGSVSVTANLLVGAARTKSSSVTDTVTYTSMPTSATSSVEATTTVTSTVTDADSPVFFI